MKGEGHDLNDAIAACAARFGVELTDDGLAQLVGHASDVLKADPSLHLTAIRDPADFVARHVGEALQGAMLIDPAANGPLLDLGSGNGYPGLALCAARPGLRPLLAEVSLRKSAFLAELVRRRFPDAEVLAAQIQRPADLERSSPAILPGSLRLLVTRAMGGWEKIVPRLASCLAPDGEVLIWAGRDAETLLARAGWKRFELTRRLPLEGREQSWIWSLRPRGLIAGQGQA